MTSFHNITKTEMESLLVPQDFKIMVLPNTTELVYGKIIKKNGHKISLRVYTAINPSGESRECGADAVRIIPYVMYDKHPLPVCKSQTIRRIQTWAKNLQKGIDNWDQQWKDCPACGYPMVERQGKNGAFWGCSTWIKTKCDCKPKTTQPVVQKPVVKTSLYDSLMNQTKVKPAVQAKPVEKPQVKKVEVPLTGIARFRIPDNRISDDQKRAELVFTDSDDHLILPSRAGGGKTTMLKHLASYRKNRQSMMYLAFNSKNAKEGRKKLPQEVPSMTTHAFCGQMLRNNDIKMAKEPTNNKNWQVMEDVFPAMSNPERKRIRKACFKLIGLVKNFGIRPTDTFGIRSVLEQYTFTLETEREVSETIEIVNDVLSMSLPGQKFGGMYTFDDMIWWPIVLGLKPTFKDVVLLDEVQDFNGCQIELVSRMLANGSRVVIVGDPFQSVYRFRGADSDAFDKMSALLRSDTKRGCQEVLLPTNYRSGRKIIEWTVENTVVKDIVAAPNAIEGEVIEDLGYEDILDLLVADFGQVA